MEETRDSEDFRKYLRTLQSMKGSQRFLANSNRPLGYRSRSISLSVGKFCSWLCILPHGNQMAPDQVGLSQDVIDDKCRGALKFNATKQDHARGDTLLLTGRIPVSGSSMLPAVASINKVARVLAVFCGGNVKARFIACPSKRLSQSVARGIKQRLSGPASELQSQRPNR
jgi:hypothetical protein